MSLPSVLPAQPALTDLTTTADQVNDSKIGKVTSPDETPLFICAFQDCNRLFPSRDRVMLHRKRDHSSDDDSNIITWNA
ncbi:hypothetical protein C8J56DRAFT_918497 [Mycena floridula]|nr:hypothetical protein C8J56DRAFT_918497 [Mycena floridula]